MISGNDLTDVLEDVLQSRGELSLPAHGFSMGASFRQAEALVLRKIGSGDLRFGSVLAFRRDGLWVAHRVIWIFPASDPRLCLTKGDAVMACDAAVMKGEEVAIVVALREGEIVENLLSPQNRLRACVRAVLGLIVSGCKPARDTSPRHPPSA